MMPITRESLSDVISCLDPVIGYAEFLLENHFEEGNNVSRQDVQTIRQIIDRLSIVRSNLDELYTSQNLAQQVLEIKCEQGWIELDKGIDDLLISIENITKTLPPSEIEEIKPIVRLIRIFRRKG